MIAVVAVLFSCKQSNAPKFTAQQIVDKSIVVSGGEHYKTSNISFDFRDRKYVLERIDGKKVLKRIQKKDSLDLLDIKSAVGFERYVNGKLAQIPDTLANSYANSVNGVHYFAYLPYGLNDPAVNKEYLGQISIKDRKYHKIKVTFNQENGGEDFEDIFIYWFNADSYKPDYLAYEFYSDGGGLRFREAYNERMVNGIRFVDYKNFRPKADNQSIYQIDSLYLKGELKLLSKIELKNILVNPGNYN